jgi:cysteine desulfurase
MRVNFDANASIKPIPEVFECLASYRGEFLNPSSVHHSGQAAKRVMDEARAALAELLGLRKGDKVIFTSGATEANNAALVLLNIVQF